MQTPFDKLARILADLEFLIGCDVCWKRSECCLNELRIASGHHVIHVNPFCRRVKECHGAESCIHHDTVTVPQRIRELSGRPFLSTCPAKAVEFIVPVRWEDRIPGVLFFGPFATDGTPRSELPIWRPELAGALERVSLKLLGGLIGEIHRIGSGLARPDPRIITVLNYLEKNCRGRVSLIEAARMVYLSPSRLSHLFRATCGIDFSSYLIRLRLEMARDLLANSMLSIGEVAAGTGFPDQNHFATLFRKYYHTSPSRYRRRQHTSG